VAVLELFGLVFLVSRAVNDFKDAMGAKDSTSADGNEDPGSQFRLKQSEKRAV